MVLDKVAGWHQIQIRHLIIDELTIVSHLYNTYDVYFTLKKIPFSGKIFFDALSFFNSAEKQTCKILQIPRDL